MNIITPFGTLKYQVHKITKRQSISAAQHQDHLEQTRKLAVPHFPEEPLPRPDPGEGPLTAP